MVSMSNGEDLFLCFFLYSLRTATHIWITQWVYRTRYVSQISLSQPISVLN